MSQNTPEEKNPTTEVIRFEITELDELELDAVAGGIGAGAESNVVNVNCVVGCS